LLTALNRAADPVVLLAMLAIVLLASIWAATFELSKLTRTDSQHVSAVSSRELLGTYEAQVVRALHQIGQTLNLVKYWHETDGRPRALAELRDKGLLPPDLVFTVSIADRRGVLVDSTRPLHGQNIAQADYFRSQIETDAFFVGQPSASSAGDPNLEFSERLNAADGAFDGVVVVAVDPAYFVSGYDSTKLGEEGVLGIVGSDGVIRIRRTGDLESSGDRIDYAAMIPNPSAEDLETTVSASSWDGVPRWTSARELYGFPLAVFVGLSAHEQLAAARHATRVYVWRAVAGSLLAILLTTILGRMSRDLRRARMREAAADLAHAQRAEYLAYHDGLTGLPNRGLFSKLLSQYISDANRNDRTLAVAFLDLDRFKRINDTLGHEIGDQLLNEVAARLTSCVRATDVVARLGGDEFVVLLPESDGEKQAAVVAQRILTVIAKPFILLGHEFRITSSIGLSIYPKDGLDEQTLTKNADIAMYQAKAEGKNNFQFYSEKLNANSLERLTLESSLRHALERNEFWLWYQAKYDLGSGRITGMEALLRWRHPDLGVVQPARFIPIAEETGLIVPIGRWVLKTACAQNVAWQRAGVTPLNVAVNLSARQFTDEHLIEDVSAALAATGMAPQLLEFEITESLLFQGVEATLRILIRLKALGVRIAVDGFGAGYASLATLRRFPLDTIKIDRSFIEDGAAGTANTGLAAAVIAMGKSLSLTVVAQGVETNEQAEFLRGHACDEIQGFYFNRPLPPEEFVKLLLAPALEITYIGKRLGVQDGWRNSTG
jgi:diguanylate cyclase (GGDEF)-like protein